MTILGATGSIGTSALDVIARHPERYRVHALTAQSNVDALADLAQRFRPEVVVIGDPRRSKDACARRCGSGARARASRAAATPWSTSRARRKSTRCSPPSSAPPAWCRRWRRREAGKRLMLANKEAIVCAGALLMAAVRRGGAELLPVDSEHNAIHQCLAGVREAERDGARLVLTASGGPFRNRLDLDDVTPDEACAHPNWVMGRKISVDSATLMNKGLEVIEASWLFDMPVDRIDVVIHPQSVIHSMVEFPDGSVLAQMGTPDMRTPLAYALAWPERVTSGAQRLDFTPPRRTDLRGAGPPALSLPRLCL